MLADLGAEVIKVESPTRPDLVRFSVYLDGDGGERPWERGAHYQKFSRNKKSCVIDLARKEGHELFLRLLGVADVFLENNTPRVRQQLGLGDDALRASNPNLITLSMPGFGSNGPYTGYLAYGLTIEGFSGLSSITGYADDGVPVRSAVPYGDPVAAVYGVIAALSCLRARGAFGIASAAELSQHETLVSLLPDAFIDAQLGRPPGPRGNRDPETYPIQEVMPCFGEDNWVALSVTPEQLPAAAAITGASGLSKPDDVAAAISNWIANQERDTAVERLQEAGIAAGPVLSPAEMMDHAQVRARGMYEMVSHPLNRAMPYSRIPLRFHGLETADDDHAPLFGEHNEYVFTELLGMAADEISELYRCGVTAITPDMA